MICNNCCKKFNCKYAIPSKMPSWTLPPCVVLNEDGKLWISKNVDEALTDFDINKMKIIKRIMI